MTEMEEELRPCTVCGEPVLWGTRHPVCGRRVMAALDLAEMERIANAKEAKQRAAMWAEQDGAGVPVVAPGPLRDLGAYLARVLDEDQWGHAEALLLKATDGVNACAPAPLTDAQIEALLPRVRHRPGMIGATLYSFGDVAAAVRAALGVGAVDGQTFAPGGTDDAAR